MSDGLPISEKLAERMAQHRAQAKKVLLVEDDDTDAFLTMGNLKEWGYEATRSTTGEDALKAASVKKFDIAIIDLALPRMSGVQVASILDKEYPMMVIVICTGHADAVSALPEALKRRWIMMLKPFDISLFNKIAGATNQRI